MQAGTEGQEGSSEAEGVRRVPVEADQLQQGEGHRAATKEALLTHLCGNTTEVFLLKRDFLLIHMLLFNSFK